MSSPPSPPPANPPPPTSAPSPPLLQATTSSPPALPTKHKQQLPLPSLHRTSHILATLSSTLNPPSSIDRLLLTATYTLRLLYLITPRTLLSSPFSHLANIPSLTALIDDTRIRLRLFSLLPILSSALQTLLSPSPSPPPLHHQLKQFLHWSQLLSLGLFQILENVAYLGDHHILSLTFSSISKSKEKIERAWLWSSRFWCLWTVLEIGRLVQERRERVQGSALAKITSGLRVPDALEKNDDVDGATDENDDNNNNSKNNEKKKDNDNERDKSQEEKDTITHLLNPPFPPPSPTDLALHTEQLASRAQAFRLEQEAERTWWRDWYREMWIQVAYLPMTAHYSLSGGLRGLGGEKGVVILGCCVAALKGGL